MNDLKVLKIVYFFGEGYHYESMSVLKHELFIDKEGFGIKFQN